MNIVLKNRHILEKIELLMQCATKFKDDQKTKNYDIALQFDPAKNSVTFSTHVLAKPAQASFVEFVHESTITQGFSIELSAQSLHSIAKKLHKKGFLDIEVDFNTTTLSIFDAVFFEPDLLNEKQFVKRKKSTAKYQQRFKMLDNTAPYDFDYNIEVGCARTINREDALCMASSVNILKEIKSTKTLCITLNTEAFYSNYFFAALSESHDTTLASAVLDSKTFNVLTILVERFTRGSGNAPDLVITDTHVFVRLGNFIVKLDTMDIQYKPRMVELHHLTSNALEFNPAAALSSLEEIDISQPSANDALIILPIQDSRLGIKLTTDGYATAESAFNVTCDFIGTQEHYHVSYRLFVEAISFVDAENTACIFGLDSGRSRAICISNNNKTRIVLVPTHT